MRITLLIVVIVLQGCVVQLKEQAQNIRLVEKKTDYKCKFIGVVTGSGSWGNSSAHDAEGAMNEVRNKAFALGANAIRVNNIDSSALTTTVVAEALSCEFDN